MPRSTNVSCGATTSLRKIHVVAAAALNGHRCEGCHLDLSAVEIDAVRAESADGELAELSALRPPARSLIVFFWFIGTAVVTVWFVFSDPMFDYRLLIVGSVLPAVVDALFGGARVLHSLTFSVVLLVVLMLATPARSPIRRTLLGLPVGTLLYLVFTGAWLDARGVLVAVRWLVVRRRRAPGVGSRVVERVARS